MTISKKAALAAAKEIVTEILGVKPNSQSRGDFTAEYSTHARHVTDQPCIEVRISFMGIHSKNDVTEAVKKYFESLGGSIVVYGFDKEFGRGPAWTVYATFKLPLKTKP